MLSVRPDEPEGKCTFEEERIYEKKEIGEKKFMRTASCELRAGARESTRQQRRHTAFKFARMWLAAVALVALAAQECSGLQFSGHIAFRSPAFAPHLALKRDGFGGLVIKGLTAMAFLNRPHGYKRLIAPSREGA